MPADEFYDYIAERPYYEEGRVPNLSDSDESRAARNTESSTECNGIPVVTGPRGDQGVPGSPGNDGINGETGIPGIPVALYSTLIELSRLAVVSYEAKKKQHACMHIFRPTYVTTTVSF